MADICMHVYISLSDTKLFPSFNLNQHLLVLFVTCYENEKKWSSSRSLAALWKLLIVYGGWGKPFSKNWNKVNLAFE